MIQKITQNNGNFWTVNLIMRAKIVNQSSDFPVRRTGSKTVTKKHWVLRLRRYERISIENRHFRSNILAQNFRWKEHPPPTILVVRKLGRMVFRVI